MYSFHLGPSDIVKRLSLTLANLVISNVNKEDAGKLTCLADKQTYHHTLLVVSGKQQSRNHLYLQITISIKYYIPYPSYISCSHIFKKFFNANKEEGEKH